MKLALALAAFGIGVSDQPNGAAPLARKVPGIEYRYQYLTGGFGANGWSSWNPDGSFVSRYVRESVRAGITPVFTYYQALSASPSGGRGQGEDAADIATLKSASTMRAYYADLALALRRARAAADGKRVIFHIEPDLWGYLMQHGERSLARRFARRVVGLRDRVAPKIALGWHMSIWGTKEDPTFSDPSLAHMRALGRRLARFYVGLGARFDVVFADPEDRDAGFNEKINGDGGASWWTPADFRRHDALYAAFSRAAKRKLVLWQVPLGNTTLDDTWTHFRDNRVQWWLGNRAHLARTRKAGVIAILYGGGADGTTQKETDGGLFYRLTRAYYARFR